MFWYILPVFYMLKHSYIYEYEMWTIRETDKKKLTANEHRLHKNG